MEENVKCEFYDNNEFSFFENENGKEPLDDENDENDEFSFINDIINYNNIKINDNIYNNNEEEDYNKKSVKELNVICEYYDIKIKKIKKVNIISIIKEYENNTANTQKVFERKKYWIYLGELKNNKVLKKYIYGIF